MAGVTKLGRPKATEAPPRSQLKAAIKEAKAAHAAVGKQKQAKARLFNEQVEAEGKIAALEKAVKKAEQAHIQAVADAAVSGSPPPVSGVQEALAAVAFTRDRIHTLRAARQTIEEEIPDWEAAALEADTEVDRLISQVIADYVEVLVLEATELSRRLAPYRAALLSFVRDHGARPTEWHLQRPFDRARKPLDEAAEDVFQFFRDLREAELPAINPWKSVRERLRENPDGAVLRHLVAEFAGLCDKTDDEPNQPVAPT
jgi:hypothetical protein